MTTRALARDETTALASHMRDHHGWTIHHHEEDDQATLRAMHRCALDNNRSEKAGACVGSDSMYSR